MQAALEELVATHGSVRGRHTVVGAPRSILGGLVAVTLVVTGLVAARMIDTETAAPVARAASGDVRDLAVSATDASHQASARLLVDEAVADLPVVPGAVPSDRATRVGPGVDSDSPNLVRATRLWAAPGTTAAAITYLRSHVPDGYEFGSVGDTGTRGEKFLWYHALTPGRQADAAHSGLWLAVTVAPRGRGVTVRGDAEVSWRPARDPATRLPAGVRLMAVTRTPMMGPQRVVILTPAFETSLMHTFDQLRPAIPSTPLCPTSRGVVDTVTLVGTGPPYVVTARIGGCDGGVRIAQNGIDAGQSLEGALTLDALVTAALARSGR